MLYLTGWYAVAVGAAERAVLRGACSMLRCCRATASHGRRPATWTELGLPPNPQKIDRASPRRKRLGASIKFQPLQNFTSHSEHRVAQPPLHQLREGHQHGDARLMPHSVCVTAPVEERRSRAHETGQFAAPRRGQPPRRAALRFSRAPTSRRRGTPPAFRASVVARALTHRYESAAVQSAPSRAEQTAETLAALAVRRVAPTCRWRRCGTSDRAA